MTPISGYSLEKMGFKKTGFRWEKGLDSITYDGTTWTYYQFPTCIKENKDGGLEVVPQRIEFNEQIK